MRGILLQSPKKLCTQAVRSVTSTPQGTDYQYMQCSKLPTMYFQRSLPRLPIPTLDKTCERFLSAVQPILNADEFAATQKVIKEFHQGEGMDLHAKLKQNDLNNKHTSYISEPWFDMYLSDRAPLPLNYNPLLIMKHDTRPEYRSQLVRATNLVVSSLRFWNSLKVDLLEPEIFHLNAKKSDTPQFRQWMRIAPTAFATYVAYVFKAFPLDMSQYNRLFGTSRIPQMDKDLLVQNIDSKHIIVMRRGNLYAVDVLNQNGQIEQPSVILARLQAVLSLDNKRNAAEVPLGVLTTGSRNDWARTRQHLVKNISEKNGKLIENEVDKALFCLCLDSEEDPIYNDDNQIPLIKNFLAGEGKNRWFDKSISLLVGADGTAAVNFEHSWGDGVAVLRYFNEIYKETLQRPFVSSATIPESLNNDHSVRSLNFDIDDKLRADVALASSKNSDVMETLNMDMLRYSHINKLSCKKYGVSPDSIMQLSFQLAYKLAFNSYVGTYESCSTAAFRHGRTETMRPCTIPTKNFCEAILKPTNSRPDSNELRTMIDKCSTVHGNLTKEAAMGQGFDRHLFALKHEAVKQNKTIPELYNTEAYRKINYNIISTSTLSSDALLAGSFGPVVQDGLGVGYSIQNAECGAIVSSYKNQRNGKHFVDCLGQAFSEIHKTLDASKK
ncbi:carnitine O-palmitoyltransferase 2, mitochondrial-like [Teleopsis dalmanni]|uniref:carnitine O-palmitoyltransferase 2, mitochondrial-like n=1 Tax=Teleopsis dalmanni TaxID=139649 RepID=UPI0018CCCEF4|nr:carnitine O-palmitoyltransferase 2, mitochondrial-like [Teleopsis dalmanni]